MEERRDPNRFDEDHEKGDPDAHQAAVEPPPLRAFFEEEIKNPKKRRSKD